MGKIHPHSNKWLLYSPTIFLLGFVLLSELGPVGFVKCVANREDSNDIGTRHVDKIPGKGGVGKSVNLPSSSSHINSHHHANSNNHDSNEVHSTSFRFPGSSASGDLDEEDDEGSYDDEDASYYDDDFGHSDELLKPADVHYIDQHEKEVHVEYKPQMAKCCPYGWAINADYRCKEYEQHHHHHQDPYEWFPKHVFDGKDFKPTNISEWDVRTNGSEPFKCGPNESAEVTTDVNTFAIVKDGGLFISKHQRVVAPLKFCVDLQLGKGHVVKSCFSREELCGGSSCLRKCCPDASFVDEHSSRCSRTNLSETYNFHNEHKWTIVHEKPACQFGHSLYPINGSFSINEEDDSLITPDFTVPFLQYCVDHFINLPSTEREEFGDGPVVKVLVCFNETQEQGSSPFDSQGLHSVSIGFATVVGIALLLSAGSIAIAALVSWRLPELRSLHGKCQLSHLATLFCLFTCLAIVQLGRDRIPSGLCKFFAVFIHTCALSSFLWLNLLCFNIYMTFRSLRPPLAARRDENRRLFFLFIYAWGIPASFVLFLFVLDSQPGRLEPMPRPQYGVLKCLISSRDAEFAYLFGPVGVLLLINGLLFCLTAQELLCGLWRLDNSDSITFRRKSMGLVVAKLGIVMGMGWILDVLSWGFGNKFVFYVGDVFNALQGVFICIVLLWRKRVLEVLHLRKPSITKDETLTVRPFIPKNGVNNTSTHADHDTSLVIVQEP